MTITHQATTVSAATTSATAPVVAWPSPISAGDLIVMEVGTKRTIADSNTSGSSEGPLNVATLRNNGWLLMGTSNNGTTATTAADNGSTRMYVLVYFATGSETGNIAGLAVASGNSTSVAVHRYTYDTTKHLSMQVTFGSDTSSGTGWSITFGENPGLKAGDKLLLIGAIPTDAVTWSVPGLTATGATFSQVAQRNNIQTTTGNDFGLRTAEWDVSTGPASAAPVWTQTLSVATTGTGAMLRIREVAPDPQAATIQSQGDLAEGVASPSLSLISGDIIVVIASAEANATVSLAETGGNSVNLEEDRSGTNNACNGRMWTYEAAGSESVTVTMTDNNGALTSLGHYWHVRGGTRTGMTKISVQDTAASIPTAVLPSLPTDALVLGGLGDFAATSNVGAHLRFPVGDDIIIDGDTWLTGQARWVRWHTWQNATTTTQGPSAPTTMIALTFAIAIPPAPSGVSAASVDSTTPGDVAAGAKQASKASTDATAPADSALGAKQAARTASDATTAADRPTGAKVGVKTTATSTAPSDRPVGVRVRNAIEATTPQDVPVGVKVASGATSTAICAAGRPAGAKQVTRTQTESTTPADRPLTQKVIARTQVESTTPTDRPLGNKLSGRASADATTPSDRPGAANKTVAGATQTAVPPQGWGATGLSFSHPAATSTTPSDRPAGFKIALRAQVEYTTPADRPGAASKLVLRATTDMTTPADRPLVRKQGVATSVESATPANRPLGNHLAAGASRASTTPGDALAGLRRANGSTRTSVVPSDVSVHITLFRNVRLRGGRLDSSAPDGGLHRYVATGFIASSKISGSIRSRLGVGRLRRRGNP